jgi:hypothetical protein
VDVPELSCPACRRLVYVAELEPKASGVRAARCPYPACASIVVAMAMAMAMAMQGETTSSALCTIGDLARLSRRRLFGELPAFLFAETILAAAMLCGGYAAHHILSGPPPSTTIQHLGRAGVVLGASALAMPASLLAAVLVGCLIARIRSRRHMLVRLSAAETSEGLRLIPTGHAYRS